MSDFFYFYFYFFFCIFLVPKLGETLAPLSNTALSEESNRERLKGSVKQFGAQFGRISGMNEEHGKS